MTRSITALLSVLAIGFAASAQSADKLERRVEAATEVLQQFTRIPEQGVPPSLLRNAHGVAVIPNTIKAGFMFGGSFGQGVLVVRQPDGSWSNPSFINMGGGSFGFQAGAQSSDIILVFKTRRSVENVANGKLKLGGDASIAAGPIGRYTQASTDLRLQSEIYAYSRTRGLFGGVSLEGSWIGMDQKSNFAYYGNGQGTAANILSDEHMPSPASARLFIDTLAAVTPAMTPEVEGSRQAAASKPAPATAPENAGAARTFSMDDAPAAQNTTIF